MTDHHITALRADDPHAFLAAVGLLVQAGPGATLRFEQKHPVLATDVAPEVIAAALLDACRLTEGHPLEGEWCRATASAQGWAEVGAPRSWDGTGVFGAAWTRMVRPAVWKEAETKHALTGLWLNTASGKIGVCTQLRALVPTDGGAGKVSEEKVVHDVTALLEGRRPTSDGPTVLGLGASRARAVHTVELLTLVGGLLQPPGSKTPDGERGLTWCLWDRPLDLAQIYPVVRDPARAGRGTGWPVFAAPIVSPDTGSYAKQYGRVSTIGPSRAPETKERDGKR